MAVSIRLRREGAKNRPYYKIVVTDSRSPRDGKFIEIIGTYDPEETGPQQHVKNGSRRVLDWKGRPALRHRSQPDQEDQETGGNRRSAGGSARIRRISRQFPESTARIDERSRKRGCLPIRDPSLRSG